VFHIRLNPCRCARQGLNLNPTTRGTPPHVLIPTTPGILPPWVLVQNSFAQNPHHSWWWCSSPLSSTPPPPTPGQIPPPRKSRYLASRVSGPARPPRPPTLAGPATAWRPAAGPPR